LGVNLSSEVIEVDPSVLDPKRWKALGVIAIAQLMVVLDSAIVNLALPSAKRELHISNANQQWVITAYTLAFGGLLLLGGRIADYVGRKRIFIIGLLGFAAASALGGISATAGWLFGARALQGAFAALLAPAALSLLTVNFVLPKERAKAFGVFGAISGGGAAIGLLLGGFLTQYFSWRWCLGVNVPIAIIAALLAIPFVTESKMTKSDGYDIPGALTATLGLLSLVYGFTKAALDGWSSPTTLTFLGIAIVLLVGFVLIELRSKSPLMPMRVLLERNRGGSYLASLIVGAGLFAMFLFLGLYLQVILRYSPLKSGFAFLPFSITIILAAGLAANLLPKIGPRPLLVFGLIFSAFGLLSLTRITPLTSYATHVLPAMIVISFGMAMVFIPLSSTALHNVGHNDAGVASALINTSQQVGGSLGTALLNTVAATATAGYAATHASLGKMLMPFALTHGYTNAFKAGAGMLGLAAVVIFFTIKVGKESLVETEEIAHVG
jgi:EmrB/QacA subfamily drug resistance transporter